MSPQFSLFCDPKFLSCWNSSYEMWLTNDRERPQVAVLVVEPHNPDFRAPYPGTIYQGICMLSLGSAIHRDVRRGVDAITFALAELNQRYDRLSFCLHPRFLDLRPLQWFNYHKPEEGRFDIELLYTGLVDLSLYTSFDEYFTATRSARQDEYRKAAPNGLHARASDDVETFQKLLELTFERQGVMPNPDQMRVLQKLGRKSVEEGFGRILFCENKHGEPVSATLFLYDDRAAYYMFGATDPRFRNTGASTFLIFENIRWFISNGISTIDMVGINSPNRGDFKTSFNAVPTPYFVVTWTRPQ